MAAPATCRTIRQMCRGENSDPDFLPMLDARKSHSAGMDGGTLTGGITITGTITVYVINGRGAV